MAAEQLEEEGRKLNRKEMDRRSMRRQMRKELDYGYAQEMVDHKKQAK